MWQCALYLGRCILYMWHIFHKFLSTMVTVSVTLYRLLYTLYTVHFTLYTVNFTLHLNTIHSSVCRRCNVNTRNKRPTAGANWLFTPTVGLHCIHYTTVHTLHYTAYPTLPTLLGLHCCTISIWLPMFLQPCGPSLLQEAFLKWKKTDLQCETVQWKTNKQTRGLLKVM